MKIAEILFNIPKGGVIRDKRVLSVLKHRGLIYDYSEWGYLESHKVYYHNVYFNDTDREWCYNGREIAEGALGSASNPFPSRKAMWDAGFNASVEFEYGGCKFATEYLSGCFKPYLIKVEGATKGEQVANPTMSLWGAVV